MNTEKLVIGVCAMDCKARSKPMRNILNRILAFNEFTVVIFGDKVILDEDIEQWPSCDFFISFFSTGFPLDKAIKYVELNKPYCVNDLSMQKLLLDRRCVLRVLDGIGISTPFRLLSQKLDVPNLPQSMINKMKEMAHVDLSPSQFPFGIVKQIDLDTIEKDGVTMKKMKC